MNSSRLRPSLFAIPRLLTVIVIAISCSSYALNCHAWDAQGHKLSAEIALEYLSIDSKQTLRRILQQHPRYQQDFLAVMPAYIERADAERQLAWLLGQAAYWPDLARGLPESEREKYNRPNWHYIDGAWVRGAAQTQGNIYVGRPDSPLVPGSGAASTGRLQQANNVMTALDLNSALLADASTEPSDKALALCWFLHLAADIHQPLHTGSLFSSILFANGDRGGNGIRTDEGNLHYRWDSALSDTPLRDNLQQIAAEIDPALQKLAQESYIDWSLWLNESRLILKRQVYNLQILQLVLDNEQNQTSLARITLNSNYVHAMQEQSRQRLALAGLRIANWLQTQLP